MDFDDVIVNGTWYTCICGAKWSESDGGPCHWECDKCGKRIDEDSEAAEEVGICQECFNSKEADNESVA